MIIFRHWILLVSESPQIVLVLLQANRCALDGEDGLAATRIARIESLLLTMTGMVKSLANNLFMAPAETCCTQKSPFGGMPMQLHTASCKTWYLGSLIRALAKQNYYPTPPPTGTRDSVQNFRTNLDVVCQQIQPGPWGATCSPKIELQSSIAGVKRHTELTSAQTKHLQEQAAKTGL